MNKLTKTSVKTVAMLTLGAMIAGSVCAEGDGKERKGGKKCEGKQRGPKCEERAGKDMPGQEERKEFHKAQQEKIKAFHEARQEKRQSNMEAAKAEEDPYKVVEMIKASHNTTKAEAEAFFSGIQAEGIAFMESMFTKYEVPEDKQAKIREHAQKRSDKMEEMHQKHGEKLEEALDKLAAKEDLTKEDIKKTLGGLRKGRPNHGNRERKGGKGGGENLRRKGDKDGDGAKLERKGHGKKKNKAENKEKAAE